MTPDPRLVEHFAPDDRLEIRSHIEGVRGVRVAWTYEPLSAWRETVEALWRAPVTIVSVRAVET